MFADYGVFEGENAEDGMMEEAYDKNFDETKCTMRRRDCKRRSQKVQRLQ